MKRTFIIPTMEIVVFESEDSVLLSGLKIVDGNSTSEATKAFTDVSSIFNGVL